MGKGNLYRQGEEHGQTQRQEQALYEGEGNHETGTSTPKDMRWVRMEIRTDGGVCMCLFSQLRLRAHVINVCACKA